MASKKRKGERARLRVSLSHNTHTVRSRSLSACLIKPNNRGKSKRPTAFGSFQSAAAAFVMDADAEDGRRALLWCPITEGAHFLPFVRLICICDSAALAPSRTNLPTHSLVPCSAYGFVHHCYIRMPLSLLLCGGRSRCWEVCNLSLT